MTNPRAERTRQQARPVDPAPPPTRERHGRRISPGLVILVVALILSGAYVAYAVTVRDASQIPLLASGAVVLGLAFLAFALYSLAAIWRAGVARRNGKAFLLGIVGGGAFIVAAGCFSAAYVLFMLGGSGL
jgi:heme/copper-type cytochrome/quinol oxidase subunit 3